MVKFILSFLLKLNAIKNNVLFGDIIGQNDVKSIKSKTFFTANETLQITSKMKTAVIDVNKDAKDIIRNYVKDPDALLKFIESKGTKVVKANGAQKILAMFGEVEGLVMPMKGFKALWFTLALNMFAGSNLPVGFQSPAMFIMNDAPANFYFLAQNFYHWLSYIKGLPGYEEDTVMNFKNVWNPEFSTSGMSVKQILALKQAVARDAEAINFVKEITRELIGAKSSLGKIRAGNGANI